MNIIYDILTGDWLLIDYDVSAPRDIEWGRRGTYGFYCFEGKSYYYHDFLKL